MSGSFRRRHSKWDHQDSEALTEKFHDKAQTRRPRAPDSPIRGSRKHDSRSKERTMAWDREGDNTRISVGPGDLRQNHSRSPKNGWGRLHRSRSRSRSRSPSHNLRREPAANDRSRSRSGAPALPCRDFVAGRCRRGSSCHFLHQDAPSYDGRQPVDCSPPDDWESRHRGGGGSKYSSAELIDDVHRDRDVSHKSRDMYSRRNYDREPVDGFEKERVNDVHRDRDRDRDNSHRSRDTFPHRSHDREPGDVFEKGPIDDVHQNKDNPHRSRDTYSHRNHDREPADVFDKKPADDVHRDMAYNHRNHDRELADGFDKKRVDDVPRVRGNPQRGRDAFHNHDRETANMFEKGPVDDVYRDKDNDHRVKDAYRNHDREPRKRGETLCKFFASGNCANGNRCRFVHEVRERRSPVRRSHDDKWGSDHDVKVGNKQGWDGPTWDDVAAAANVAPVRGWGEETNEVREVAEPRPEDNSRSNDMLNAKETWARPVADDGFQMLDKKPPLQWDTENSAPSTGLSVSRGVENISGDMEISPRDVSSSDVPSLSNIYEKPYPNEFQEQKIDNGPFHTENPSHEEIPNAYHGEERNVIGNHDSSHTFERPMNVSSQQHFSGTGQIVGAQSNSHFLSQSMNAPPQPGFLQPEQPVSAQLSSGVIPLGAPFPSPTMNASSQPGFLQTDQPVSAQPSSGLSPLGAPFQSPAMNVPSQQHFFPTEQIVNAQPSSGVGPLAPHFQNQTMNAPSQHNFLQTDQFVSVQPSSGVIHAAPGQVQFSSENCEADRMQLPHNSSFLNNIPTEGPQNANPSGLVSATAASLSTVSNEQLAQLSNLSASLAQLLENRQQLPQFASNSIPVFGSSMQTSQVPEMPKQQYDPLCDSVDGPNVHNSSYPGSAHDVVQKSENKVLDEEEAGNMKQQESVTVSKDDEKNKIIADGSRKELENRASEDMPADEGDDGNKSKDTKAIRPFKFALAELVKELLKPSWKDGQVSKDAYKTIVKKVVDKIIDTQGLQIPQTKDKIDQYLSCSKPKIDKLVQAYVGKFQKN
ncbi:hypothetical protein RND81_06G016400 [Saponaria officinalis]|uniref:C3H1-type domain-containing protein n=1 Tax=Saponaria officinalis TaxID=3572 RepID=A0AAW1K5N9_SAPOF